MENKKAIMDLCRIPSGDELYEMMEEIVSIGFRRHGTKAEKEAARYLLEKFKEAGLEDVSYETYKLPAYKVNRQFIEVYVQEHAYKIPCGPIWFGASGDVRAELISMDYGMYDSDVWHKRAAGKIVFVRSDLMGNVSPTHDTLNICNIAKEAGAAGLIIGTDFPYDLRTRYVEIDTSKADYPIPAVIVSYDDRVLIEALIANNYGPEARILSDVEKYETETGDVVGYIKGNDDYLFLICHYDSTEYGATDNAAAEAGFIKTAEALVRLSLPRPTIVFIGHSGHESFYGTRNFAKNHEKEIKKGFLCLNYDGFASPGHFRSTQGLAPTGVDDYKLMSVSNNPVLIEIAINALKRYKMLPALIMPQDRITAEFANGDSEGQFAKFDVPVMGAGSHNVWYHTARDTPDKTTPDHLYRSYLAHIDMIASTLEKGPDAIKAGMCKTREEAMKPFLPQKVKRLNLGEGGRGLLFGMSPQPAKVGQCIKFYYVLAIDCEEVIVDYEWDFGDGNRSKEIFTQHIFTEQGRYKIRFTCTDSGGFQFSAERILWVW